MSFDQFLSSLPHHHESVRVEGSVDSAKSSLLRLLHTSPISVREIDSSEEHSKIRVESIAKKKTLADIYVFAIAPSACEVKVITYHNGSGDGVFKSITDAIKHLGISIS